MKFGCRPWLILSAVALTAFPAAAPAQRDLSHGRRPYVSLAPEGDLEQILQDNLQRLKGLENLRGLLDRLRAHKDLLKNNPFFNEEMLKRLEKAGTNFELNDQDKKLLGNFLDKARKHPDWLEKMKKTIPDLGKDMPDLRDKRKLDEIKKLIQPDPKKAGDEGAAKPEGGIIPDQTPPADQPPAPPEPADEPEGDFTDTVRGWLERMENWKGIGDLVKDSPTIQGAIEDFSLSLMNDQGGPRWDPGRWLEGAGELADYAERGWGALESGLDTFGHIRMDLPRLRLPSFGSMPSFGVPNLGGGPSVGSGLSLMRFLVWGVAAVALGLIFWQLWTRHTGAAGARRSGSTWRLGAWPVNPAKVANRRELIAAFEYLALLILGPAARTWNHRDIALNLAGQAPQGQRLAAHRLAGLYEQARYAPDGGPLAPEAVADARRDLYSLAGVSAA